MSDSKPNQGLAVLKEVFDQLEDDRDLNQFEAREALRPQLMDRLKDFVDESYSQIEAVVNGIEGFPYRLSVREINVSGKGDGFLISVSRNVDNAYDKNLYLLLADNHADKDVKPYRVDDGVGKQLVQTTSVGEIKKTFLSWLLKDMDGRDKRTLRDALASAITSLEEPAETATAAAPADKGTTPQPG